jgi:Mlc titration factor MtfA (ptsG expression regulator)
VRLPRFLRSAEPYDFPDEWLPLVSAAVAQWPYLSDEEHLRMQHLVWSIVHGRSWEAAYKFELTDDIKVTIAAQAALLVLALDFDDPYNNVSSILVHPTTIVLHGERGGYIDGTVNDEDTQILGLAQYNGPVVIAWDEAQNNARHPERGHNVVYHEFAHKLDMIDGMSDGTPPLASREQLDRWIAVCTHEYEALRDGMDDGFLSAYGGVNPAEFFAVVTEVFFDIPVEMEQRKPDLYGVLRDFYQQDPAARIQAHSH